MNLLYRILLPLIASSLFSMVAVAAQAGVAEIEESCSCTCANYLDEKDIPECQSQCYTGWEERQCAVSAMPEIAEKDAETLRFESELRQLSETMRYPLQENVIASQVYTFQISEPEQRQALWQALENNKSQLAGQQEKEAADAEDLQNKTTEGMDAETLRYKAAVEQLNLPPGAIEDLVEMFQSNDATMREMLWQRVQESPLRK